MHVGLVTQSQVDYALSLANELHAEGVSVTLYMDYTHTAQEVGDSDNPQQRLYDLGLLPPECQVRLLKLPRLRDLRSYALIRGVVRAMHADGVSLAHILLNPGEVWLALLACLLTDTPVTVTLIVPVENVAERIPGPLVWASNRLGVHGADMVVVNGADQVELVKRLYGVSSSQIAHVPLSLHTRALKWSTQTVTEDPGTVLFFGRATPYKGLEYLVKAQPLITSRVPHARILIVAHGDDLQRCQAMIRDPSKFEITEGVVPGDVMAALFKRASLVALPYLTASTSGVLVTAFSYGRPVVATQVGCLPEYVEDGVRGMLVAPANVEELADAIVCLLQDDSLRRQMGANAARWVEERQMGITKQTLAVYEQAISLHRNS